MTADRGRWAHAMVVLTFEGIGTFLAVLAGAWLLAVGIAELLWWSRFGLANRRSRRRRLTRWRYRRVMWLARRAERLATRRRRGGGRGLLGRGALWFLVRQATRYSVVPYARWEPWSSVDRMLPALDDALWRVWLAGPDEQIWRLLGKHMRDRVFAEAVNPARSAAERAAIGTFCAAHGLAPQNTAERAMFFVLTGQPVQHRAADPDGARLAAAYHGANEPTRAAVREALAGSGDLDLICVVAGTGRERLAEVTVEEASYLAGQLAGRRDWAGLWRLVLDLPLVMAANAMGRLCDDRWKPPDERGLRLLECFGRTAPDLQASRDFLLATQRISVAGSIRDLAFSLNGQRLVVLSLEKGSRGASWLFRLLRCPGARPSGNTVLPATERLTSACRRPPTMRSSRSGAVSIAWSWSGSPRAESGCCDLS